MSCDPIGIEAGLNVYVYCNGNPINRIDKSGSDDWCVLCTPWDDDVEGFHPFEYASEVIAGFGEAAYHTAEDTFTRSVDLATQFTAVAVKAATGGIKFDFDKGTVSFSEGIQLPYTEWNPEAKRYDPELSIRDNIRKTGYETKEGVKALAKGVATAQPKAVGTLGFVVATSVGGKPPNFPNIPFVPMPRLVTSVTTAGTKVTELAWQSTAVSTSAVAKFGGPILAVAATSDPGSVDPQGEPFSDPAPPNYKKRGIRRNQSSIILRTERGEDPPPIPTI